MGRLLLALFRRQTSRFQFCGPVHNCEVSCIHIKAEIDAHLFRLNQLAREHNSSHNCRTEMN